LYHLPSRRSPSNPCDILYASPFFLLPSPCLIQAFGLGGTYTGYCDGVIKGTLFNYMKIASENEKHTYPPPEVTPEVRSKLYTGIKTAAEALSGAELEARASAIASEVGAPQAAPWAVTAAQSWERILRGSISIDDAQSNTLGKLIPLAVAASGKATFEAEVEAGISVTQCSAVAVAYHTFCARLVEAAVLGEGSATTPLGVVEAALGRTKDERVCSAVREAMALGQLSEGSKPTSEVIAHFGAACAATSTVPLVVFMLVRHGGGGFEGAVRFNLLGESAARACVIGAVLGALGGKAPEAWVEKLNEATRGELLDLAPKVAAFAGAGE
jgi:hypothetical protein